MGQKGALDSVVRLYTPADYQLVCSWWKEWGWPCLPESCLPEIGLIEEEAVCAWLIRTDCNVAWLAYIISTKSIRGKKRQQSINRLIYTMETIARSLGFKYLHALDNSPHLAGHYKQCGFVQNPTQHFIKEI